MGIPTYQGKRCPGVAAMGIKPTPAAFGRFIAEELPYYYSQGVRRFSLYNEPNLNFFMCSGKAKEVKTDFMEDQVKCTGSSLKSNANLYYRLYRSGFGAIKELQRTKRIGKKIEVLIGEISSGHHGIEFMDLVLKNGPLKAHGMAVHPYQFCTDPSSKKKTNAKSPCKRWMPGGIAWVGDWKKRLTHWAKTKRLRTPSGKRLPLLLTEFGYLRSPVPANIPERFRAKWYPKAMNVAKKFKVKQMLIFGLFSHTDPKSWDSGILAPDGSPLASFNHLKSWAKKNRYVR
jgi:hypothetical protein